MGLNPYFLNTDEILNVLLGELPAGVYAEDRADNPDVNKRSVTSSELRAHAQMLAGIYSQANAVFNNFYITTLQADGLAQWEIDYFGAIQSSALTFDERIQNLSDKFRAQGGINLPYINGQISNILTPQGLTWAILPLSGQVNEDGDTGTWILGYSSLGQNTYLGGLDPENGSNADFVPLDCDLDYAAAGLTLAQLQDIQNTAYAYEVRIYGHADADTLAALDAMLTKYEPARSTHYIMNDASPPTPPT